MILAAEPSSKTCATEKTIVWLEYDHLNYIKTGDRVRKSFELPHMIYGTKEIFKNLLRDTRKEKKKFMHSTTFKNCVSLWRNASDYGTLCG